MKLLLLLSIFSFSYSAPTTYRASQAAKVLIYTTEKVTLNNQRTHSYTKWGVCSTGWNTYTNTMVVVNGRWVETAKPPEPTAIAIPTVPYELRSEKPGFGSHFDYGRIEYESVLCAVFEHVSNDIAKIAAQLAQTQRRHHTFAVTTFKWSSPSN
uniref:Non-structural protein NS7b n=1 Tax=Hipposideros bat coronavirus HKU10 TaxID=1241932 RepID=K4JZW6_9ALPC|nr:non-structural protein NS7b [Hipposideros bat coronavirus HKU10]AFU92137.1 non-structural protein NS7b [Hipposideros bat coronavirus HKU10]